MNFYIAARACSQSLGVLSIGGIGIGNVQRPIKLAVRIFPIHKVIAFRRPMVPLPFFSSPGLCSESHLIRLQYFVSPHQLHGSGGFFNQYPVGSLVLRSAGPAEKNQQREPVVRQFLAMEHLAEDTTSSAKPERFACWLCIKCPELKN